HVDEDAFRRVAEEVSRVDLKWLFGEWLHATPLIDYRLRRVERHRLAGGRWRTVVTVERKGAGRMPVEIGDRDPISARATGGPAPTISTATTAACPSCRSPPATVPASASASTAAGRTRSVTSCPAPRRLSRRGPWKVGRVWRSRWTAPYVSTWASAPIPTSASTPCGWPPPTSAISTAACGRTRGRSKRAPGSRPACNEARRSCGRGSQPGGG